jgi:NTP pyrophosphatase (non-canonical NTP hydrolase)
MALANIHGEVSEALECVRDGYVIGYQTGEKPEGLPSELADIVIRVADLCGHLGINLERAIEVKMQYNATRPHKHGRLA